MTVKRADTKGQDGDAGVGAGPGWRGRKWKCVDRIAEGYPKEERD